MITTLETDRLVLRPFTAADLADLVVLHADESFWWYPLRRGMTEEETAEFLDRMIACGGCRPRPGGPRTGDRRRAWSRQSTTKSARSGSRVQVQ